jgi:hypothetical protein
LIAYIDTSVLIRIVFSKKPVLAEWDEIIVGVTSTLTRVETYRTLHRMEFERGVSKTELDSAYRRVGECSKTPINTRSMNRPSDEPLIPYRCPFVPWMPFTWLRRSNTVANNHLRSRPSESLPMTGPSQEWPD